MDLTTLLEAAFLGVVEGLTEFLPVSSTGHLILLDDLLGFEGPPGKVFEIVIQLGAILAVCWVYRQRLFDVLVGLPSERGAQRFILNVLLAFLPAAAIGVIAYPFIKQVLFSTWVVAITLVLGGIAIIVIERLVPQDRHAEVEALPWRTALWIGIFQCIAMIPGVSRSGATIMGALLLGVERRTAAEFSFFLAIPTMFAATVYDLYKNRAVLTFDNSLIIVVGFVLAFVSALFVVRTFIGFVGRHGFVPFAVYRIVVGLLMLGLLFAR
jgi:undecaprenyl-diphosphatase